MDRLMSHEVTLIEVRLSTHVTLVLALPAMILTVYQKLTLAAELLAALAAAVGQR
jgi:hypothetical protein